MCGALWDLRAAKVYFQAGDWSSGAITCSWGQPCLTNDEFTRGAAHVPHSLCATSGSGRVLEYARVFLLLMKKYHIKQPPLSPQPQPLSP